MQYIVLPVRLINIPQYLSSVKSTHTLTDFCDSFGNFRGRKSLDLSWAEVVGRTPGRENPDEKSES
jgi:hypothetical protein